MAEETDNEPETDLKALRTQMADTRSSLEEKLSELKSRFISPRSSKRKITMATKKPASKAVAKGTAKKKTPMMKTKTVQGVKKTATKVIKKTKEVLGEMLAGAATGAVKGAAEAIAPQGSDKKAPKKSK